MSRRPELLLTWKFDPEWTNSLPADNPVRGRANPLRIILDCLAAVKVEFVVARDVRSGWPRRLLGPQFAALNSLSGDVVPTGEREPVDHAAVSRPEDNDLSVKSGYLKWFSLVVWLGVLVNLYFAVPALFVPDFLISMLDLDEGFRTVWLRNAGLLIFIITAFHVLAAMHPVRYPAVGWMIIAGRLAAAIYWLIVVLDAWETSENPDAFLPFLIGDVAFGLISAVLLYFGLRQIGPVAQRKG